MSLITIEAEVVAPHLFKFDRKEGIKIFQGAMRIKFATDEQGNSIPCFNIESNLAKLKEVEIQTCNGEVLTMVEFLGDLDDSKEISVTARIESWF